MNTRQNAFALVVGIGNYRDEKITPLQYTHADARAFAELLTDQRICGVPSENVKLLVDEQATLFAIKDGISGWLAERSNADSTVIIFYAGHGDVEPDRAGRASDAIANYLLPYDTSASNLYASALSKEDFQGLVKRVPCKRSVILMDACHSGGVATTGSRKMSVGYSKDMYSTLAEGAGSTVIAAAAPNQLSWEDKELGHGIFTYHLLEALRGEADVDGDGKITMLEVFNYLKRKVPESARKFGGAEQTPVFKADMMEDIVLTINPERIVAARREAEEAMAREKARVQQLREQLYKFEQDSMLPPRAHGLVIELIDKPEQALSPEERLLLEQMNAMFAGIVSVGGFVAYCDRFRKEAKPDPDPLEKDEGKLGGGKPTQDDIYKEVEEADVNRDRSSDSETKRSGSDFSMLIYLISFFMPLVGIVAGLIYMSKPEASKKKIGRRWLIVGILMGVFWFLLAGCAMVLGLAGSTDPYYYY